MPTHVTHLPLLLFEEEYSLLHQFPKRRTEDECCRGQRGSYRDEGHYGGEDLPRVGTGNLGWSLSRCQETHEVDRVNVGPSLYQMQAFGPNYHHRRQEQERVESAFLERRQWMHNVSSKT